MNRRNALVTREEEDAVNVVAGDEEFSHSRVNPQRQNPAPSLTRELVAISPVAGPPDPIRQGDTPARHPEMYVRFDNPATSHNPHYVEPDDETGRHDFSPGMGADMPIGLFLDQNERRRLDDGSHA